jgi:hypothetical protein
MLGMLPPSPYRGALEWFVLLGLLVIGCFWQRSRSWERVTRRSFEALAVLLGVALFLLMLPNVARVERLYYEGQDQFYWGKRLHSAVPEERREAAVALALLKSGRSDVRILVIQELGECSPAERGIALDALLAFAKDENETEFMRWQAEYAIGVMFFQHVVGDLGTEEDREPYQKMILTHGWDAAARHFAAKKQAEAQKQ